MANLPKGTTLNNTPIIVDSTKNDHRHNASSVIGLNEDVQGGGEIYAEFIDGVSYEQIQSTFVSENNNTMTGILSVTSGNNTNNIVSKSIVDNILISRGVKDYSLSTIPSTSETQAVNSIVHVGSSGSIDTSWLPGSSTSVNSNISISDVPSTVDADTNYEFKITNFNAFSNYSVSVDIGNAGVYGDGILWYNAPDLSRSEQTVNLSIEKDGSQKEITFTLSQDLPLSLSLLIDGSFENVPDPLVIDSTDTVTLRIDSYKSGYNYNLTGDLLNHGFTYTINNNTIDIIPPSSLSTVTTNFSVSDGYDTTTINVEVENTIYNSWIVNTIGGDDDEIFYSVIEKSNGGFIAVGNHESQSQGNFDGLIAEYDSELNLVKSVSLGDSVLDQFTDMVEADDGYIIIGRHSSLSQGSFDGLIVKYDFDLNVVAQRGLGSFDADYFQEIIRTSDNNYVVVGYQESQGQGGTDALIVKYDSNLNLIKQSALGGSGFDYFASLTETSDGGFIVVGYQGSQSQGNYDALIVKYDSNLNLLSQRNLSGALVDIFRSVIETSDGNIVVVGNQSSQGQGSFDILIVTFDANLNIIGQTGLGGDNSDYAMSITETSDGGFTIAGYQQSNSQGIYDALIVSYDSNLNIISQKSIGGFSYNYYNAVIQSLDNGLVTVGQLSLQNGPIFEAAIVKHPTNLNNISGTIINHNSLQWSTQSLITTIPNLQLSEATLVEYTPTLSEYTPLLTESLLSLTERRSEKQ